MEYPNDEKAVIFSFPQEEDRMAIGFESFIVTSKDRENLGEFKESEECIVINWPEGYDVGSAKATRKIMKKCVMARLPARVIDFGDRGTMLRRLRSLERTGQLSPPKTERKKNAAKKLSDSPTHKPKRKIKRIPKAQTDKENAELFAMIMQEEDKDDRNGEGKIDDETTSRVNKVDEEKKSSQTEDETIKTLKRRVDEEETHNKEDEVVKKPRMDLVNEDTTAVNKEEEIISTPEDTIRRTNSTNSSTSTTSEVKIPRDMKSMTDIGGGVFIRNKILSSVQKMKDIEQATSDLINAVFDRDELASCSYSGTVPNVHRVRGLEPKPQLNKEKVSAIREYIFKYFEDTKGNKKLFKSRIGSMCSTAAKSRKPKAMN